MYGWKKEDKLDEVWVYELEEMQDPPTVIVYPETNFDDYFDLDIIRMRKKKINKLCSKKEI